MLMLAAACASCLVVFTDVLGAGSMPGGGGGGGALPRLGSSRRLSGGTAGRFSGLGGLSGGGGGGGGGGAKYTYGSANCRTDPESQAQAVCR